MVTPHSPHEGVQPAQPLQDRPLQNGEHVVLRVRSDKRINLADLADGAAIVNPVALDKLALSRNVRVDGDQQASTVLVIIPK